MIVAPEHVPRPPLRCEVHPLRDEVHVRPIGDLDLATLPLLAAEIDELRAVGFECVVADLRELTFLDVRGAGFLLERTEAARAEGWSFEVLAGPGIAARVLALTGIEGRLDLRQ
jgi:anti-anti-sigma factor